MGKAYLGDEGMEKVKKGDFSQILQLGEQFLGEQGMNDLLSAAADTLVQMKKPEPGDKHSGDEL